MTDQTFDQPSSRNSPAPNTGIARRILFTDGAKYVAGSAGAYWLLDEIAVAQCFEPAV